MAVSKTAALPLGDVPAFQKILQFYKNERGFLEEALDEVNLVF